MRERPHPVRVFLNVNDAWSRRVLRDALSATSDIRLVSTPRAADVRIESGMVSSANGMVADDRDESDVVPPSLEAVGLLTVREREVLQLLSEGLSNGAIGDRLGISRSTVKFHLSAIFEKLDVHTRTEAVSRGLRRGDVLL